MKIDNENGIRILGDKFVDNNKNTCKILFDGKYSSKHNVLF